jgi:hypothetical protein
MEAEGPGSDPLSFETLNGAWWEWVDANCPSKSPRARGKWMHANVFTYDGTTWHRDRGTMKSNSGKTTYTTSETFVGADGRVVSRDSGRPLNRRNDPERDWGLPD